MWPCLGNGAEQAKLLWYTDRIMDEMHNNYLYMNNNNRHFSLSFD